MEIIGKREAWNKDKLVGQKPPLKPKDVWAIRIYLQNAHAVRDLAMFNLAIDSKLRGCDLVGLRVRDVTHGPQILPRAMVIQKKTQRPVQFELTEPTRAAVAVWLEKAQLRGDQYLFPSRVASSPHVSTRQYARIVHHWVAAAGLDSSAYGTHSMRRTKATPDLQTHKEPEGRSIVAWPYEAGKHCPISWNRGRRRARDFRANRNLTVLSGGRIDQDVRPLSGIVSSAYSRPEAEVRPL